MSLEATEARVDRGMVKASFNSPHRIECSNGQIYVVKPRRGDRQFANEILAFIIGRKLGVPIYQMPRSLLSMQTFWWHLRRQRLNTFQVRISVRRF